MAARSFGSIRILVERFDHPPAAVADRRVAAVGQCVQAGEGGLLIDENRVPDDDERPVEPLPSRLGANRLLVATKKIAKIPIRAGAAREVPCPCCPPAGRAPTSA
jgi:hypothetical protein